MYRENDIQHDPKNIGEHQSLWIIQILYGLNVSLDDRRVNILRNWLKRDGINYDALLFFENIHGPVTSSDFIEMKQYVTEKLDQCMVKEKCRSALNDSGSSTVNKAK